MTDQRRGLGARGERLAEEYLRSRGYAILERNVRSRWGEMDLVARDGQVLVFVEVRTLRSRMMSPEESVDGKKQRRLAALASRYLQAHDWVDEDWRIDVVAIEVGEAGQVIRLAHHPSAVEE